MAQHAQLNRSRMNIEQRIEQNHDLIGSLKARQDQKRSRAEKAADSLTSIFGSMWFLIGNFALFAVWLTINIGLIPGVEPFDPFPFGLLTTIVSLEAIGLAIIVLISQNRSARIADLREEIDLQIDLQAERELTKVMEMLCAISEKLGIDLSNDPDLQQMLTPTAVDQIEEALEKEVLQGEAPADEAAAEGAPK